MKENPTITVQGVAVVLGVVVTIVLIVVVTGFVIFTRWGRRDRATAKQREPSVLDSESLPRD